MIAEATTVVDAYLEWWNETDAERRAERAALAWSEDGHYVDPLLETEGHAALCAMAAAVHDQYPGHRFRRTTGVDGHHDQLRFGWELVGPDGTLAVAGVDVGLLARDGRLDQIVGFFGDLPQVD